MDDAELDKKRGMSHFIPRAVSDDRLSFLAPADADAGGSAPRRAPTRFRTSYILYASHKQKEIREELQREGRAVSVS